MCGHPTLHPVSCVPINISGDALLWVSCSSSHGFHFSIYLCWNSPSAIQTTLCHPHFYNQMGGPECGSLLSIKAL